MSPLARRLLLAAAAGCLAALLGWAVLAAAGRLPASRGPRVPFHPGQPDDRLGWVLKPDWSGRHTADAFDVEVRTNAFGQRGGPRDPARRPGVQRILLVGDSFAFGWGVDEERTFASLLPQQLGGADRCEVVDAAVPGWNAANEYLWLVHDGAAWQPDVVLLQLCSNDLQDFTFFEYELGERNLPVAIRTRPRLAAADRERLLAEAAGGRDVSPARLLQELSEEEIDALVTQGIGRLADERRTAAGPPPEGPIEALTADEVRRGLDSGAEFQGRYLRHVLAAIGELCAARGVPLRLLAVDAHTPAGEPGWAAITALCADGPAPCLPSSTFIPADELERCFFRHDPHWTPEGHRRAADALGAWLAADPRLLPSPAHAVRDRDR